MGHVDLKASEWAVALYSDHADETTQVAFEKWLAADPEHELAYLECEIALLSLDSLAEEPEIEGLERAVRRELALPKARIVDFVKSFVPSFVYNKNTTSSLYGISRAGLVCACFGVFFVLIFLFSIIRTPSSGLIHSTVYATTLGEQKTVVLNDGSEIILNTNTHLQVRYEEQRRHIELSQGEAVFAVAHDPERPFDVVVGDRYIRAVGTRFNVYVEGDEVTISLLEGKIKILFIEKEKNEDSEVINAGVSASYNISTDDIAVISNGDDIERINAWLKGQLEFEDWQLLEAVNEHNRYTDIKIHVEDETLRNMRVGGFFKIGDTESFLAALQAMFPIEVSKTEHEVWLKKKQ